MRFHNTDLHAPLMSFGIFRPDWAFFSLNNNRLLICHHGKIYDHAIGPSLEGEAVQERLSYDIFAFPKRTR